VDAHDLFKGHGKEREGVAFLQIFRCRDRKFLNIFEGLNIVGPNAHPFHSPPVKGGSLISVLYGPFEPLKLVCPQGFDRRKIG
jgi:hypothetical protein